MNEITLKDLDLGERFRFMFGSLGPCRRASHGYIDEADWEYRCWVDPGSHDADSPVIRLKNAEDELQAAYAVINRVERHREKWAMAHKQALKYIQNPPFPGEDWTSTEQIRRLLLREFDSALGVIEET